MDPRWRAQALEGALRSYSLVVLAHEGMAAGRPIEEGWSTPSDIQDALVSWRRFARALGATPEDFDRAREIVLAERRAALAESESEARVQDAIRQDFLATVADFYGIDLDEPPW